MFNHNKSEIRDKETQEKNNMYAYGQGEQNGAPWNL